MVWRTLAAAAAVCLLGWCAWAALRAGASRLVSDYGARFLVPEAVALSLRLTPSDPEAHYARAGLLAEAGDHAGAVAAYERVIALRPRDYVLWVELGKSRDQLGDAEGALAAFREAARLAPHYAQPRWQLGNALLRAGRRDEAFTELRRAASSDPRLYPNLLQALWYASGGDPEAVASAARPDNREEALALARFLTKRGEVSEAMRLFREAGGEVAEAERAAFLAELLGAGSYEEAYEVWSVGGEREAGGGAGRLTDGGFEGALRTDDRGFGWRFSSEANVKASLDSAGPRDGARSLRIDFSGNSAPAAALLSQLVLVEPGGRYRLSFSLRAKDVVTGGPLVLRINEAKGAGEGAQLASTPPLPAGTTEGWRDFALDFTAPSEARAVRLTLHRQNCTTSPCPVFGSVWLDGFGLKKL